MYFVVVGIDIHHHHHHHIIFSQALNGLENTTFSY